MAMKRTANSLVTKPSIQFDEWMAEIREQNEGAVPRDFVARTAKTLLRKCDPNQYLLSHATIVASVDTYAPRGVKTGRGYNRGIQIDVRWPDFRIKPDSQNIVNNNGDCWERSLLLSTYKTFVGAHNYLEHIQIPELSKGFIVDAIARDLGPTVYIDILVATDRKHNQLVSDIISGEINAMSMGCISLFTTCTKCGNVASDDSQVCPCIQYDGKRQTFFDQDGNESLIAEIIGHVSVPNSNQFIEASWVKIPAFEGAVRRNILNENSAQVAASLDQAKLIHEVKSLNILPTDLWSRAASHRVAEGQQQQAPAQQAPAQQQTAPSGLDDIGGGQGMGGGGGQDSEEPEEQDGGQEQETSSDPVDKMVEDAQKKLMQTIVDGLDDKIKPKPEDVGTVAPIDLMAGNQSLVNASTNYMKLVQKNFPRNPNLVRWACQARQICERGLGAMKTAGITPRDLIVLSWIEDRCRGSERSSSLYQIAMQVGPSNKFPSEKSFLASCKLRAGRALSVDEQKFLVRKGRIASASPLLELS